MVDPRRALPTVELDFTGMNTEHLASRDYDIVHEDGTIGMATICDLGSGMCCFAGVELDKEYRNKGLGLATYITAIELAHSEGKSFCNDVVLTKDSAKIWNILNSYNVAEVISPIKVYGTVHIGRLVIPPR
jgi:GNAT superfamily N-acetyltransferase